MVELFTGPGVSDAARADLKKEMTKKGVRKNIVDNVLSKLVAGGGSGSNPQSEGSENGDAGKKEYVPPSLALQSRKPTGGTGTVPGGVARPASRSAMVSPPIPLTPVSEGNEVHPVYVSCFFLVNGTPRIYRQFIDYFKSGFRG